MGLHLLTPRLLNSDTRIAIQLSDEDYEKTRGRFDWRATVTDQETGKRYLVRGAPCTLPRCFCDAIAFPIIGDKK